MRIQTLIDAVRKWGVAREIIGPNAKATVDRQMDKLDEEFMELDKAIACEDMPATIDGIGDMAVVLILLSELVGTPFENCLEAAYKEIKDRRGVMVGGVFVKEVPKP